MKTFFKQFALALFMCYVFFVFTYSTMKVIDCVIDDYIKHKVEQSNN